MRRVYPVALVMLGVALLWPWSVTVVPEWTVVVKRPDGQPIPKVPVLEAWRHQTVEQVSHTQLSQTDESGRAVFPRREITVSALRIAAGAVSVLFRNLHESGFGPLGQVVIGIDGQTTGCELLGYMPRGRKQEQPLTSTCIVTGAFSLKQL